VADRDHAVTEVVDLRVLEVDQVQDVVEVVEHRADAGVPPIRLRLLREQPRQRRVPLDLRIELGAERLDVAAVCRHPPHA
jgi:hypothetical protein